GADGGGKCCRRMRPLLSRLPVRALGRQAPQGSARGGAGRSGGRGLRRGHGTLSYFAAICQARRMRSIFTTGGALLADGKRAVFGVTRVFSFLIEEQRNRPNSQVKKRAFSVSPRVTRAAR